MQLKEAIERALALECRIRDLYAESARKIKDTKGQQVFATLAREEQGHVHHLQDLKEKLAAHGQMTLSGPLTVLPEPAWIKAEAHKLSRAAQAAKTSSDAFHTELDLLKEALDLERQASSMYRELIAGLPADHKGLFEPFLDIEDGHLNLVQAEIDALVGHGHWFDFMEFRLEA